MSNRYTTSVIVTVHNSGDFLRKCLSSLYAQDLNNLEIVIINDASPDPRDDEIIQEFIKNKSNVKYLINEHNMGTGHSREIAIARCEGEYIGFLDSDDYVEPYAFKLMYDQAIENSADIVVADFLHAPNWSIDVSSNECPKDIQLEILSGIELFDSQINRVNRPYYLRVDWWNKIYKRSLFVDNAVELPHVVRNEGSMSMVMSLLAKRCCIVNHPVFYTTSRPESVCRTFRSKNILDIIVSTRHFKKWLQKIGLYERYQHIYVRFFFFVFFDHNVKLISRLSKGEREANLQLLLSEIGKFPDVKNDFLRYLNLKDKFNQRLIFGTINTKSYSWDIISLSKKSNFFERECGDRKFIYKNGLRVVPDISIVTICKDILSEGRKEFFQKMLDSVSKQGVERGVFEHIVIDAASKDGTVEYLRDLHFAGKIDYWISEPDTGIYNAMNKGIMHAHGKHIIFLNSDDYLMPYALKKMLESLRSSGADYVFADAIKVDESEKRVGSHFGNIDKVFFGSPYCHQTVMCARYCFDDSYFDEEFKITMWSHALKLYMNGYRHIKIPEFLACFRVGGISTNSNFSKKFEDEQKNIKEKSIVSCLPISYHEYEYLNHTFRKWPTDKFNVVYHEIENKLNGSEDPFVNNFLNAYKRLVK